MSSITKEQLAFCKLAQFSQALQEKNSCSSIFENLPQIDDVNVKVLSNKPGNSALIGGTPLHIACFEKHIDAIHALLERNADFTIKNKNGRTLLHEAFFDLFPSLVLAKKGSLENKLINLVLTAHVRFNNTENPHSTDGLSHFHLACAFDNLKVIKLFLNSGVFINESVNVSSSIVPGYTPLHFAARFSSYETAQLLLERGANVHVKDAKGLTPLHVAIQRNFELIKQKSWKDEDDKDLARINKYIEQGEAVIMLLMNNNRGVNVDDVGFSKLHAACTLSDSSLVENFIQNFDINCAISMNSPIWPGYTALHFAIQFNNVYTIKLLLRNGANIHTEDANGITPFDLCIKKYTVGDIHDILLAIPVVKDITFSDNTTRLSDFVNSLTLFTLPVLFVSTPENLHLPKDCPLWPGYSLHHLTVLFSKRDDECNLHIVDFSIETYFRISDHTLIQDSHGRTPLHLAFYQRKERIINMFFEDELGFVDFIDNDGLSHLHIACKMSNENAVRAILTMGANVNSIYKGNKLIASGSTPLHVAVTRKNVKIVKMLLEFGADVNLIDDAGMTPIIRFAHHVFWYRTPKKQTFIKDISNLLFMSSELKNFSYNKTGLSHLHIASFVNNEYAVKRLLDLGADPNIVYSCATSTCKPCFLYEYTPIHYAIQNKDWKIIKILLQSGAEIFRKRSNGMTILYDVLFNYKEIFEFTPIDNSMKKLFGTMMKNNKAFQKRVKEDSGLTLLHIACIVCDFNQIQSLLKESNVDVNAQMHANSPIWPKATPLHLLIECNYHIPLLTDAVRLMLYSGADVTLMDNMNETPVLQTWRLNQKNNNTNDHLLRLLLTYQVKFSINPVNEEGISHFHLSCRVTEYKIVEKYLENGVDVNLPIDYFSHRISFITPLHFLLKSPTLRTVNAEPYLQTIDVLLKYGVDVNVQDESGFSPLHLVAHSGSPMRERFYQKLHKAGADLDLRNLKGQSFLEIMVLSSGEITNKERNFFIGIDNQNFFNTFNSLDGTGILAAIIANRYQPHNRRVILDGIVKIPNLLSIDEMGRTPIHNIVAIHKTIFSSDEYIYYIEKFIEMGFDIDAQDSTGATALHMAAYFHNEKAIDALLISGADLNLTDKNNQTALEILSNIFESRAEWCWSSLISKVNNRRLITKIELQIIAMQLCSLEVNPKNLLLARQEISENQIQFHCETILNEIENTQFVKIGQASLTPSHFLSETGAIAARSLIMDDEDFEAINKFFEPVDSKCFPELRCILKLQHRKMLTRLRLMESANDSLRKLVGSVNGFSMPKNCCCMILRLLTNSDIKHLIMAVSTKAIMQCDSYMY